MKKILFTIIMAIVFASATWAKEYKVTSPDSQIIIKINVGQKITYSIETKEGTQLVAPSVISIKLQDGKVLGYNARVKRAKKRSGNSIEKPVVPEKYAEIENRYNGLKIVFKGGYSLSVRAYNDGVAYRWETDFPNEITVANETAEFRFPENNTLWFPEVSSFYGHQEEEYKRLRIDDIEPKRFAYKGILVNVPDSYKIFLTESGLEDYPGIYYSGIERGKPWLKAIFPGYPLKTKQEGDRDVKVTRYADFIAKTKGKRVFPWRVFVVAPNDAALVASELVWKLAPENRLTNTGWIKPGKVAWDWWNALNITGVDFKSGVNTDTYKYFIDFAHDYNIPYIILDEGWYDLDDVLKIKKNVNLPELLQYAEQKNVGIILWVTWKALDDKLDEALETFEKWGVKGIKVDFMQRDDQWMVNYYWKVAKKAAEHHLLVDYHGAYQPSGLRRAYPNVITREAIAGLEQDKWGTKANPIHDVTIPFTRMVCGPMDYTPGAMINATKKNFRNVYEKPMSMGTRCHQLAMYVVYESPLQMLADSPSHYKKEKDAMDFLSQVPTVWDDTKVLDGKIGEYILLARKSGDKWYIGAMTNWKERDIEIDFGFLDGKGYYLDVWQDGMNADRDATDYKRAKMRVNKNSQIKIHLAPGGGLAAVLEPMKDKER